MSKKKSLAFIVIATLVHFGLMLAIIASRLDCGILPHCVSRLNMAAGAMLAFPINVFTWAIYPRGTNFGSWYFVLMFINSLLAVSLILLLLNRIIFSRKNKLHAHIRERE